MLIPLSAVIRQAAISQPPFFPETVEVGRAGRKLTVDNQAKLRSDPV